jgi:hypothetical protein
MTTWDGLQLSWWLLASTPLAIGSDLAGRFMDEARCVYFGDHGGAVAAIRRRDKQAKETT